MLASTILSLLLTVSASYAGDIDVAVEQYSEVKEFTDITYKGLPVRGDSLLVCYFLGYNLATGQSYTKLPESSTYYELNYVPGPAFSLVLGYTGVSSGIRALAGVTCAR